MTEPIRPKRVSMAYVLGFSNKPFKEDKPALPPPPPPPPKLPRRSPFTEAGGIFEWTASDGRRGKLTGRGRPRLTAANVAVAPSEKQPNEPASKKSVSKKAIAEAVVQAVEDTGGLMGLFDDTPAVKDEPKPETSAAFTDEQDKTLMEMKTSNNTWAEIATKLGKDTDECKTRFKVIKPAGWKPDEKGGNQKKEQNKGGNKGKGQGKQSGVKEKKDGKASTNGNGNDNGTTGNDSQNNMAGFDMWGSAGQTPDNTEANPDTGTGGGAWGTDEWASANDGGVDQAWDQGDGGDDAWKESTGEENWATTDGAADAGNTGSGATYGAMPWDTVAAWGEISTGDKASSKAGSKAPSKSRSKAPSKAGSKTPSKKSISKTQPAAAPAAATSTPATDPLMYEITPDDTFSADDLRTIARILQQDAKMVWNRVSWRFRDKTGRQLDPDVFEEKITGRVEGKRD